MLFGSNSNTVLPPGGLRSSTSMGRRLSMTARSLPDSGWTWFATEGEEEDGDFRFFGYVIGQEEEWGYFVLSELQSARGPLGLSIERDLYFKRGPFSEVITRYRAERGN